MFRYGFELEAFCYEENTGACIIGLPPRGWPVDGMPGLVELRSTGHHKLDNAYFNMLHQARKHKIDIYRLALQPFHTFTPEQKRELRKRDWGKQAAEIQNIYGKKPKALGNKTIASLQINISYLAQASYHNDKGELIPDRFNLFDIPKVVHRLDKEFRGEIIRAGRQLGEYAIKDGHRLEYRSLPNDVAKFELTEINTLLDRIQTAVEGNYNA